MTQVNPPQSKLTQLNLKITPRHIAMLQDLAGEYGSVTSAYRAAIEMFHSRVFPNGTAAVPAGVPAPQVTGTGGPVRITLPDFDAVMAEPEPEDTGNWETPGEARMLGVER